MIPAQIAAVPNRITGLMFHNNCGELTTSTGFADIAELIEDRFGGHDPAG